LKQLIVFYHPELFYGSYIGGNNSILHNCNGRPCNKWMAPVGLAFGKTLLVEAPETLSMLMQASPTLPRIQTVVAMCRSNSVFFIFS
jgi:hypothetical protein